MMTLPLPALKQACDREWIGLVRRSIPWGREPSPAIAALRSTTTTPASAARAYRIGQLETGSRSTAHAKAQVYDGRARLRWQDRYAALQCPLSVEQTAEALHPAACLHAARNRACRARIREHLCASKAVPKMPVYHRVAAAATSGDIGAVIVFRVDPTIAGNIGRIRDESRPANSGLSLSNALNR